MSTPTITAPGTNSAEKYEFWFFYPEQIEEVWLEAEQHVEAALKTGKGELSVEDVKRFLLEGSMMLFTTAQDGFPELFCVTELLVYPQYKSVRVVALGGKNLAKAMQHFRQPFMEWVLATGAVEVEGWSSNPLLRKYYEILGFHKAYDVMRCDLRGKLQ